MSTKTPRDSEPEQSNPPPGTETETKQPLPGLGKEDKGSRTFTMRELLSELKTEGGDDYSTTPHSQGSAQQSYQVELNNAAMELIDSITCMDEESRSRQQSLAYAARRWAIEIERNPEDHEALYNLGLILQDSANNVSPDSTSPSKHALLEEACRNYEEATRLNPTLDEAFYNWAMAIADRAKMRGRTKEAEELWMQAAINYEKAVQLNWKYPQALNNWGLALQEISATVPAREKPTIVRKAISRFRAAIRLQFDFHRAIYNLGTVLVTDMYPHHLGLCSFAPSIYKSYLLHSKNLQYALAEDTFRTQGAENANELYCQSSIYIVAAYAMKPNYSVYSSALGVVRSMLPLPYLKVGYLKAHPAGKAISPHCDWKISQFLLNHEGLQQISKEDEETQAPQNLPRSGEIPNGVKRTIRVNIPDIVSVTECADLSLPPGPALWISTICESVFLIADSWDSLDGWLDAIRLVYTIYAKGHSEVLAGIVTG